MRPDPSAELTTPITAEYSGDGIYDPAISEPVLQVVNKAAQTP